MISGFNLQLRSLGMQPRSLETEQPKMITQKYFYFQQTVDLSIDPETYDQAASLRAIIENKSSVFFCASDTSLTLSELRELDMACFKATNMSSMRCVVEVIVTVEELKKNPLSSYLAQKEHSEYFKRDGMIARDLITVENTSKLYFGDPVSVNEKAILNPAFVDTHTRLVKEEKAQRVAFVKCLVENNVINDTLFDRHLVKLVSSFFQKTVVLQDSLVPDSIDDLVQKAAQTVTKK
jgi:hypothetical protein